MGHWEVVFCFLKAVIAEPIPFRIHENTIPAVFALDQYAVPAEATGVKPHLAAVIEQENLIVLEAVFLKLPELLIA